MKKYIFLFILFFPIVLFSAQAKWNISLIELQNDGSKNEYNTIILESLKSSLNVSKKYNSQVYANRQAVFLNHRINNNSKREDMFSLSKKMKDDFLISGEYFVEGEQIFILLYAIDTAYQQIKISKTYTGEAGIDIFDLLDEIARDFTRELEQALPEPDQATVIKYRKKLKLVSEADKFPRTMYNNIGTEVHTYQIVKGTNITTTELKTELQFYYQFQVISKRWLFGLDMSILSLSFPLDGRDSVNTGGPDGLNIRFLGEVGYSINEKWLLGLYIGINTMNDLNGRPQLVLIPSATYLPGPNWKWEFDINPGLSLIPGNVVESNLGIMPVQVIGSYYFSDNLGLNFKLGFIYSESKIEDHGSPRYLRAIGGYIGLGLAYRLGIDT